MTIVKFPGKYIHHPTVRGRDIWKTPEPSEAMVWEVCPYLRQCHYCDHCPRQELDPVYGPITQGCFVLASEACRVVMVMQRREKDKADNPQ